MGFARRLTKLASETAVYGVSSIVGRMIGYLLVPFYTWFFSPDRYGVVLAVYAAFVFLNILYTYGMEAAYLRFAGREDEARDVDTIFTTATWSLLGSSILLSVILVLFRDQWATVISLDPRWSHLLLYAAAIVVLDTMVVVPFAELRLQNRPWRFAAFRIAGIAVNVLLNVALIAGAGWGVEAVFLANLCSSGLVFLLHLPLYAERLRPTYDPAVHRRLLRFGLPFLPSGLGFAMTEVVNRTYIGRMTGTRVLELYGDRIRPDDLERLARQASEAAGAHGQYMIGVFGAMLKIGVFMMLAGQMFRFAWQPFFLEHADDEDARPLFARVFTLFTAGSLLIFLGVSFFARELVEFPVPGVGHLIDPSYWIGLHVVPLILVAYLFQGWYYVFSAGLYLTDRTVYFVICTGLGAAVTLGLNVWLVPVYGMAAAAWATVAAYGVMAGSLFVFSQRVYSVPYEWNRVAGMILAAGVVFGCWYGLPSTRWWVIEIALIATYAAGLWALNIVTPAHVRRALGRLTA